MTKFLPILFVSLSLFCFSSFALASTTDGAISGYAWSDKIGWINFGTTNGDVRITDTAITGYAWNENTGRINLDPTESGVKNNSSGTLSGKAWAEGTGWIDFTGVTVNSSGVFAGTAVGDNDADIYFSCDNCNVTTDWRPASSRTTTTAGGGGGLQAPQAPFGISINNNSKYTNSKTVELLLNGGPDAVKMAVSNLPDFSNILPENYLQTKTWELSGEDGTKTVYVKFYTEDNVASSAISSSIILDTKSPEIKITSIKKEYTTNENVVISGTTEPNAEIIVLIDEDYGMFFADEKGEWFITLGKFTAGAHYLEFTPKDLAGNTGETVLANFLLKQPEAGETLAPPLEPILRKLEQGLQPLIPKFFKPAQKPLPKPIVTIPKQAPVSFSTKWRLLPERPIARFVLAPLPKDVALLEQKFPQVAKTFSEVGITKVTDVQKIQNSNLSLPGLTETIGLAEANVATGKFAMVKGIPLAQLSSVAKSKIPSGIVFSKAGGGLVDFNVALSVNSQGKTEQRITTVVNTPLQLVVKPEGKVKRVHGYIIFKSKKPTQPSLNVKMNDLAFSYIFSDLNVLMPASLSSVIPVEGSNSVIPAEAGIQSNNTETRLVLVEFEYIDSGGGVYTATVQTPVVDGEYEIITVMDYEDTGVPEKEIKLITVIDPEGYIFEKNKDKETRIVGAVASLYWQNPNTKQYELWPAKNYQQENPQTTDVRGTYSFLVPDGYYYLKVDAPGYLSYDGKPFQVTQGSGIHVNVELKTKFWFLSIVDWKTCLLIVVILLLLYNFYRDKMRERQTAKAKI